MSKNKPLPGKVKQDGSRIPFQQNQMTEEFQMQRMKITFIDMGMKIGLRDAESLIDFSEKMLAYMNGSGLILNNAIDQEEVS